MEHQDKQQQEYKDLMKSIEMPFDMESHWENIEEKLPPKKKRRGIIFWFGGILLVAIIVITIGGNFDLYEKKFQGELVNNNENILQKGNLTSVNNLSANNLKEDFSKISVANNISKIDSGRVSEVSDLLSSKTIMETDRVKSNYSKNIFPRDEKASSVKMFNKLLLQTNTQNQEQKNEVGVSVNQLIENSRVDNTRTIDTQSKVPTKNEANREREESVTSISMADSKIILSNKKSGKVLVPVYLKSNKIQKWSIGLSQQLAWSNLSFYGSENTFITQLNEEIESTYQTKTSLYLSRAINDKFFIIGGFGYKTENERIVAERVINIQEQNVLSDRGSLYTDNQNITTYHEAFLTETTTTVRKIGQNNKHNSIGIQLGIQYLIFDEFYLSANGTQFMILSSKGKTISDQNSIVPLENKIRNGGFDLDINAGYGIRISRNLKLQFGINSTYTIGQFSHLEGIKRKGVAFGGTIGLRYLLKK